MGLRDNLPAQNATSNMPPSDQSTSSAPNAQSTPASLTMPTLSDTTTVVPVVTSTNSIPSTETATETHCTTPDATTVDTPLDMTFTSSANVTSNDLVRLRDHVKKPSNPQIDLLKINASGKVILKRGEIQGHRTMFKRSNPLKSIPLTRNMQLINGFLIKDNSPVKRTYVVSLSSTHDDNK